MTFVVENYKSKANENIIANIQQEKYSACYQLDIYKKDRECPYIGHTIMRKNYFSIKNAKQAMKHFSESWIDDNVKRFSEQWEKV